MQLNKDVYKLELKEKNPQIVPYQKNILFRNSMYPILLQIYMLSWNSANLIKKVLLWWNIKSSYEGLFYNQIFFSPLLVMILCCYQ